jgi:hypothetical protein
MTAVTAEHATNIECHRGGNNNIVPRATRPINFPMSQQTGIADRREKFDYWYKIGPIQPYCVFRLGYSVHARMHLHVPL